MASLNCVIIGRNPDGCFTWRHANAEQPRGVLPREVTPQGVTIGSEVCITLEHDAVGRKTVTACSPAKHESNVSQSGVILQTFGEPPSTPLVTRDHLAFGQVRWTDIRNPLENATAVGKERPALLISGDDHRWRVMGLTRKSHYKNGLSRMPIPDYVAVGLQRPGYLWGARLTRVDPADIGDYIGTADTGLLRAVLDIARADLTEGETATIHTALRLQEA
jgi:hypothetical protein